MIDLPKGNTVLSKDDSRAILAIHMPGDPQAWFRVGRGCTRIEAYDENGDMASIPWLAVFDGDEIIFRTAAAHVGVAYR